MSVDRRPSWQPGLSVCCLAGSPVDRAVAVLALFRDVADEIVCAIDERVPRRDIEPLVALADICFSVEVTDPGGSERVFQWLNNQCSQDWVLRIDTDEVPSAALLAALPHLVRATDVVHYVLPRRWCFPDPYRWIDERPWSTDWQARLMRNLPTLRLGPERWHAGYVLMDPHRYVQLPFYHLDCAVNTPEQRTAKVDRYELLRPGHATPDGFPVNGFYLPEHYAARPPAEVPDEDARLIASVVRRSARHPRGSSVAVGMRPAPVVHPTRTEDIDRFWANRTVRPEAYRAIVTLLEELPALHAGATTTVNMAVRNDGSETWPWGDFVPAFRLGHRWFRAGEAVPVHEGPRTLFTADVGPGEETVQPVVLTVPWEPGRYVLELDVLQEHVRWCGTGTRLDVDVLPMTT